MTEQDQPTSPGAAFWAARGVRIEPEAVDGAAEAAAGAEPAPTEPRREAVDAENGPIQQWSAADAEGPAEVWPAATPMPKRPALPSQRVAAAQPQSPSSQSPLSMPQPRAEAAWNAAPGTADRFETSPVHVPGPAVSPDSPASTEPASSIEPAPSTEPAWQLTGGELALPLPPLKTCLEAILMVVDEPTTVVALAQVLERPKAEVAEALVELAEEYTVQGRGFELREVGLSGGETGRTGWRIYSRPECAPVVERFVRDGQQAKLTQAALETLAVVAYRQPVSRSKVSAIRGVNCDGVMRTLLARGLVEEYGSDLETGALLYQTTGYFLERMGLRSLEELPDLAPLLPGAAEVEVEDFA